MGRPRKWKDEAERKAAERDSPKGDEVPTAATADEVPASSLGHEVPTAATDEVPTAGADEVPALSRGTVEWQGETWPILRRPPHPHRDTYIAQARTGAELHLAAGGTDPAQAGAGRLERAERYATWRYDGWLTAQVDGL